MASKKEYPIKEGWLHATLTINPGKSISFEDIKNFITWGNPSRAEFSPTETIGRRVKFAYRESKLPCRTCGITDEISREKSGSSVKWAETDLCQACFNTATNTKKCTKCSGMGWVPSNTDTDTDPCHACFGSGISQ